MSIVKLAVAYNGKISKNILKTYGKEALERAEHYATTTSMPGPTIINKIKEEFTPIAKKVKYKPVADFWDFK